MKTRSLLLIVAALGGLLPLHAQDWANQGWAKENLEKSPRHQEWVKLKQGSRELQGFLVFPEVKEKATAVIVIHENRGLTDWVRSVADQLAAAGYIALAPDLLSGSAPNGGGTLEFTSNDAAGRAISALDPEQVTSDLRAMMEYASKLPACNGKVVVSGFCWGGSQTFRFATNQKGIKAAFVFYGTGPTEPDDYARIEAPVYGFYGENDSRVNATIARSEELMKKAGDSYEPVIYADAGHGFMRSGEAPGANASNKKARDDAWARWLLILKRI